MSFKETPFYLYSDPDVILVVGEEEIKVHEHVIAPQSEFFKTALKCGLKETHERRIALPEIQPDILVATLDWLYRATLKSPFLQSSISRDNDTKRFIDIMSAFDFLQIKGAGREYSRFVEENLHKIELTRRLGDSKCIFNTVTIINEVYKSGGSITKEGMSRLFDILVREPNDWAAFCDGIARVSDPDGRCFHDISAVLSSRIMKALINR